MGVFLAPGETYAVENTGSEDLRVLSVLAPEDRAEARGERKVTVRFDDQPELEASVERSFRYLVNEDAGCYDVTQFMGIVQPSKAPFHSHTYDEVGYIVAGEGIAHVGGRAIPLKAGSCFHLPPDEVHCIENPGTGRCTSSASSIRRVPGQPRRMRTTSRLERRHMREKTG